MPKAAVIFNLDERASEPAHHISVGEVADKVQTPRTQRTTRMSLSRDPTNYPAGKILGRDSSQFYESPHRVNRFGGRVAPFWADRPGRKFQTLPEPGTKRGLGPLMVKPRTGHKHGVRGQWR